ncbi:MAG: M1 family peptidase [Kouleothrix sp.]|nr:M1 family peptidase [Kouleothrix sp.]
MLRAYRLILCALLLSACAATAADPTPTPASTGPSALAQPSPAATPAPTHAPASPTATPAPTRAPASPTVTPPDARLDVQAQATALRQDYAGDLSRAGDWNRYTISAAIDPAARTIAGRERLEYTNRDTQPLERLYLHLYPNLPDFAGELSVTGLSVDGRPVDVTYEARRYLLRVDLPQPLAIGATAVVELDFATTAPERVSQKFYGAFNKEQGILSLASSYPIAAIVRRGAWDTGVSDPQGDFVNSETALYDVTLTAPADWQLVTTGVVVDKRIDGERQVARMVSGPQRDFMIVATQYRQASVEVEGTRINSYYRPEHEASGNAALQAAADALRAFNKRYGPYPLAELDVVEVAAWNFLGVEYPGLIEIEQSLYGAADGLEITVAHEVAHQWWYSQVGNDVLQEAWVDEAMASYSQIVYQEDLHGPDAAARELDGFRQRYRRVIDQGRDAPVERPTTSFRGNYVGLVYGKAVLFFQAMRKQIGEEAFDRFLHEHYARHRYGYITGTELLADAEGACGCDLQPLYEHWITTVTPVDLP